MFAAMHTVTTAFLTVNAAKAPLRAITTAASPLPGSPSHAMSRLPPSHRSATPIPVQAGRVPEAEGLIATTRSERVNTSRISTRTSAGIARFRCFDWKPIRCLWKLPSRFADAKPFDIAPIPHGTNLAEVATTTVNRSARTVWRSRWRCLETGDPRESRPPRSARSPHARGATKRVHERRAHVQHEYHDRDR